MEGRYRALLEAAAGLAQSTGAQAFFLEVAADNGPALALYESAGFERVVVVKKILSSHNEDPQFVEMFINEAKIAAQYLGPYLDKRWGGSARRWIAGQLSLEAFIARHRPTLDF